jgi:uncharacterized damage-inducible protein DinB
MSPEHVDIGDAFLARSLYYLTMEYPAKLRHCIAALGPDAIWWRPNEDSNSIGNLLLHLAGNIRQWIVSGVGGASDVRDRAAEFSKRDGLSGRELVAGLDGVLREAGAVLARLTAADLTERRVIQGRDVTVLEAICHVVEHCAMHTGQVILLTKVLTPGRIHFYDDADGLARPLWREPE